MQQVCRCQHSRFASLSRWQSLARLSARLSLPQLRQTRVRTERCHSSASAATLATHDDAQKVPTFVPRSDGITDGKWDQQDEAAVLTALQDAQKAVKKRSASQPGAILSIKAQVLHVQALLAVFSGPIFWLLLHSKQGMQISYSKQDHLYLHISKLVFARCCL